MLHTRARACMHACLIQVKYLSRRHGRSGAGRPAPAGAVLHVCDSDWIEAESSSRPIYRPIAAHARSCRAPRSRGPRLHFFKFIIMYIHAYVIYVIITSIDCRPARPEASESRGPKLKAVRIQPRPESGRTACMLELWAGLHQSLAIGHPCRQLKHILYI